MVHYVRFLKPPRSCSLEKSQTLVKALITVTTDLGDDFLPCDLALGTCLLPSHDSNHELHECHEIMFVGGDSDTAGGFGVDVASV